MKAAPGTGTIQEYETRHGTRYKVALPRTATGGKRLWRSFSTREEAERVRDEALAAVNAGVVVHPGDITLGEYALRWLERCRHLTVKDEMLRWKRFMAPRPISELTLSEVTTGHVKRFIESVQRTRKLKPASGRRYARELSTEFVGAQMVRHVYGLLNRCFKEAIIDGHIDSNPCASYKPPNAEKARTATPPQFLSKEEIEQILTCGAIKMKRRLLYEFAIFTGLRAGELWGLRWEDIRDLNERQPVCICRRSYEGKTKNKRVREFVLLPRAAAALRRWRDLAKATRPGDLIFPGRAGRMASDGYDGEWGGKGKNRERAGIRSEVRFHDFRHTFASHLVMGTWGAAWRLEEVKEYIGHSSISVTQRYAHLSKTHLADLASRTKG